MKSLELELPDGIVKELDALVMAGLYLNAQEAVRHALSEFLRCLPAPWQKNISARILPGRCARLTGNEPPNRCLRYGAGSSPS